MKIKHKHLFLAMTGKCMTCGKFNNEECTLQKPQSLKGKYGVFMVVDGLYQGCWEVRKEREDKSKWLPYSEKADARKRCDKQNKKLTNPRLGKD
jgi:hypothetical protein